MTLGELQKEVGRCHQREFGEKITWVWYRDVILQAQEKGLLKIIGDSDFHVRKFSESIEVLSEQLKVALADGSLK